MKIGCNVAIGGRDYLEDSITVIKNLNDFLDGGSDGINRSYFAVFDGHGGALLSDFLSRQFHLELCKRKEFLTDPKLALELCWRDMDNKCLTELTKSKSASMGNCLPDGSTATICLIVGRKLFIANCGDSSAYAFMSSSSSQAAGPLLLTDIHSTDDLAERRRCELAGGEFRGPVQRRGLLSFLKLCGTKITPVKQRVYPGGLLVTRAFGDFHAKRPQQGGIPGVVIADCGTVRQLHLSPTPQQQSPDTTTETEEAQHPLFIVLASDGVWDGVNHAELFPVLVDVLVHGKPVPEIPSSPYRGGSKAPGAVAPAPSPDAINSAKQKNTVGKLNGVLDGTVDKLAEYCVRRGVSSEFWRRNYNSADNASCIIVSFV